MSDQSGADDYFVNAVTMQSEVANGGPLEQSTASELNIDDTTDDSVMSYERNAAITGRFTVTVPWPEAQAMQVTPELSLGEYFLITESTPDLPIPYETTSGSVIWPSPDSRQLPSQWTSGSIDVVAVDGSRLSLLPMQDDTTRPLVDVTGISEPQQVLLSNGFQVRCFGNSTRLWIANGM